jgi:hypothetical protein
VFGDAQGRLGRAHTQQLRQLAATSGVQIVHVLSHPHTTTVTARETVIDSAQRLRQACNLNPTPAATTKCAWALLRPDSYLCARGSQLGVTLVHAIARLAGTDLDPDCN